MDAPQASASDAGKAPQGLAQGDHKPVTPTSGNPGLPPEFGGREKGLEPTRYGDWEKDGRCIDF